jgi:hypothetical protein
MTQKFDNFTTKTKKYTTTDPYRTSRGVGEWGAKKTRRVPCSPCAEVPRAFFFPRRYVAPARDLQKCSLFATVLSAEDTFFCQRGGKAVSRSGGGGARASQGAPTQRGGSGGGGAREEAAGAARRLLVLRLPLRPPRQLPGRPCAVFATERNGQRTQESSHCW